ncbi:hypothetical protein PtB15_2B217 [Puccinia triticina]|nr:hypothetical protein PtB15_2B217 [Puccinia triticina]
MKRRLESKGLNMGTLEKLFLHAGIFSFVGSVLLGPGIPLLVVLPVDHQQAPLLLAPLRSCIHIRLCLRKTRHNLAQPPYTLAWWKPQERASIIQDKIKEETHGYRRPLEQTSKKAVIIESGPAGLACADQLNRAGHTVTVYDRNNRHGGLLMSLYGILNMKFDKEFIQRRLNLMAAEPTSFVGNTDVGVSTVVNKIRANNHALVVSTDYQSYLALYLELTQPKSDPPAACRHPGLLDISLDVLFSLQCAADLFRFEGFPKRFSINQLANLPAPKAGRLHAADDIEDNLDRSPNYCLAQASASCTRRPLL